MPKKYISTSVTHETTGNILTLQQVIDKLQDRKPWKVAKATGLHAVSISIIRDGKRKKLHIDTFKALETYFIERERMWREAK